MPTWTLARPAVTLYRYTPPRIPYPRYPGTPRSSSARTDQRCQQGRWRARPLLFSATHHLAFRIPPTRERRGPPRPAQISDANGDVGAPGRYSLALHAISHPANIEPDGSWEKLLPTFAACGNNHSEYRVCLMARNKRTNPQNASIRGTDPMPERGAIFATSGQSSPPPARRSTFRGGCQIP